jgi:hypothetical protein
VNRFTNITTEAPPRGRGVGVHTTARRGCGRGSILDLRQDGSKKVQRRRVSPAPVSDIPVPQSRHANASPGAVTRTCGVYCRMSLALFAWDTMGLGYDLRILVQMLSDARSLAIDPGSVAGTSWCGNQPNGSHCAYSSPVESNPYGAMQYGLCMYVGTLQHRCLMMILYADSGRSQGPGGMYCRAPGDGAGWAW